MPPEMLLNCFISGLKPEFQRELAILKPHSLSHAIGLSKLLEAKFLDARFAQQRYIKPFPNPNQHPFPNSHQNLPILSKTPPPHGLVLLPHQSVTYHPKKCMNIALKAYVFVAMTNLVLDIAANENNSSYCLPMTHPTP